MPALQLTLLVATLAVLGIFLVAAGLCFRPCSQQRVGIHLVKVTGPVSCTLVVLAIWRTEALALGAAVVGLVLLGLALGLFLWALRAHRGGPLTRIYCGDVPTRLIRSGPYRWVRHPCYTAYLLAYLAGAVATGAWWLAPVVLGNLVLYVHAAWTEEQKFSASGMAEEYATYRNSTGMIMVNPLKLLSNIKRQ